TLEIRVAHSVEYQSHGLYRFYIGHVPTVVVYRADLIEIVLTNTLSKSIDYSLLHSWLGTGLLTSSGSKWKTRRRMLTPAFHFRILDDFVLPINEHTKHLVTRIRQLSEQDDWVDVVPLAASTTLDVLLETIMGITTSQQQPECQSYVKAANFLADQMVFRAQTPWLLLDFIYYRTEYGHRYKAATNLVHTFSTQVIQKRRKELIKERSTAQAPLADLTKPQRKRLRTFLDILLCYSLDSDDSFTDEDIREEVDTFMFEGHDTTALAIAWALYMIALHPEIQQKIQQELDAVLGNDLEKNISMNDMKEFKYLDCVTKECQRLYPSVPFIGRAVTKELRLGDYLLPEGTTVDIFIYALHRDPKIFPDPEVFDPERFSSENSASRHPFAFIPFSAGSRNCI
ncbi:P450 CYP319A1, putative, partial [Ixodes scapularis]